MAARAKTRSARTQEDGLERNAKASYVREMRSLIKSLRGCCKGEGSMAADREREHRRDDAIRTRKL